jgi:hypothetical protein
MPLSPGITQPKNTIRLIRGTSKTFLLTVTDEADERVDLAGARIIMSVKRSLDDEHTLIQKDSSKGATQVEIITPTKGGQANIYLTPSDTNTMDVREYTFDVWVILSSGKRYAVIPPSVLELEAGVTVIT